MNICSLRFRSAYAISKSHALHLRVFLLAVINDIGQTSDTSILQFHCNFKLFLPSWRHSSTFSINMPDLLWNLIDTLWHHHDSVTLSSALSCAGKTQVATVRVSGHSFQLQSRQFLVTSLSLLWDRALHWNWSSPLGSSPLWLGLLASELLETVCPSPSWVYEHAQPWLAFYVGTGNLNLNIMFAQQAPSS